MSHSKLEVADVFRRHGEAWRAGNTGHVSHGQLRVMSAIEACRTAELGGHVERCEDCAHTRIAYNSCRNRHCPKCQTLAKAEWLEARQAELLPVGYFHNVFTLPHQLNALILCREQNQRAILNLLFQAVSETLLQFGRNNLDGTLGATLVLHTWDQQLRPHFHLHAVIPGGVLSFDGTQWLPAHTRYLFPVRALSKVFRGKFLTGLQRLFAEDSLHFPLGLDSVAPLAKAANFAAWIAELRRHDWVVYSKAPFAGPEKLLSYLGHYTHRVAISNRRLISGDDGQVVFHYRDRAAGDVRKTMTLPAHEFLRRFLCHVLPGGFQRIRHYGLLASRNKSDLLAACRQALHVPAPPPPEKKTTAEWLLKLWGIDVTRCPRCGRGGLERTELPPARISHAASIARPVQEHDTS
jgi:hypothetical protein